MATFESALPASAVLTLTKGATDTGVKAVIDETRKTATFTADSKYVVGTYTVTATAGTSKQSKDLVIEAQKAKDIIIKSTTALVNPDKKQEVFVYYDVVDQYGESMRASTNVTWTSGTGKVKTNKTTGCLTISKEASGSNEEFKYGDDIYLVGVDIKNGITIQKALKVGMERALDKIDFVGFINTDDRNNILKTLPKDFAVNKYRLLFTAYDQEGNPMNASPSYTDVKSPKVTFIADNPTLIKPEFKSGGLYTINGIEYCSVTVEPGMYVDKGGEVNITAISNTTGAKTVQNYVVGDAARLQSIVLSAPDRVVADGDQEVNIPFVAKDINGKEITNYETIVRSTNTLKLTATEGTLTVYETETGAAAVRWDDNEDLQTNFTTSSSHDGVNRNIALVTVVVGGESNNMMMEVSDTRRPVAISKVKLNDDNNNTITENNKAYVDFFSMYNEVRYIDQYNEELEGEIANAFFKATSTKKGAEDFDGHEYGVKVDYSTVQNIDTDFIESAYGSDELKDKYILKDNGSRSIVIQNTVNSKDKWDWKDAVASLRIGTKEAKSVMVDNLKYSVVRLDEEQGKKSEWSIVDAEKNIDYTIVPVGKLSNLDIRPINKVKITTKYSKYANGAQIETASSAAIAKGEDGEMPVADKSTIKWNVDGDKDRIVNVIGTYDGKVVTIPYTFYSNVNNKEINPTFTFDTEYWKGVLINGLVDYSSDPETSAPIRYSDLYDFNTAKNIRKDTRKNLFVNVYNKANSTDEKDLIGTVKTSVSVSDEQRGPVKIAFIENWGTVNKLKLDASDTNLTFDQKIKKLSASPGESEELAILVTDQYGDGMIIKNPNDENVCDLDLKDPLNDEELKNYRNAAKVTLEYSVTNLVENKDEFAHLSNSFVTNRNGSELASIDGAEIKDTFDLTATIVETGVSIKIPVVMDADECAELRSGSAVDEQAYRWVWSNDNKEYIQNPQTKEDSSKLKTLRDTLGYDR